MKEKSSGVGPADIDPFNLPPYPWQICVAAGKCHENSMIDTAEIKIYPDGTIDFHTDPLDDPTFTFTPEDADTFVFLAAHLERQRDSWRAAQRAKQASSEPVEPEQPLDLQPSLPVMSDSESSPACGEEKSP
jgi:hypothetical protein